MLPQIEIIVGEIIDFFTVMPQHIPYRGVYIGSKQYHADTSIQVFSKHT
jgi:hypothetical protein